MLRPLLLIVASVSVSLAQSGGNPLSAYSNGEGVQGEVNAIVVQPDGKAIIGGLFTSVNGVAVGNLARLNADGTLDKAFSPTTESGTNGPIYALGLQKDGKIVLGGLFSRAGSSNATNLARFNADGTLDQTFGVGSAALGANAGVLAIAVCPDGSLVIGGSFSIVQGQPRRGIARLKGDGSLAATTASTELSGTVKTIGALPSIGFVAGGVFSVQGQEARGLIRQNR